MKTVNGLPVRELRCRQCRAFITYERILAGYIMHRCPKCGYLNEFEFKIIDAPSVRAMIEKYIIKNENQKGGE